jgi:hypothetical protein
MKCVEQRNQREKKLCQELEEEKARFVEASRRLAHAIQKDLVLENWVRVYPIESFTLFALVGFGAGYALARSQKLDIRPGF